MHKSILAVTLIKLYIITICMLQHFLDLEVMLRETDTQNLSLVKMKVLALTCEYFLKIVILHVLSVIHMYSDNRLMHTLTNDAF